MALAFALLLAPPALAALLSLAGPLRGYVARLRVASVVAGAAALGVVAVVMTTAEGPTFDGLLLVRHPLVLTAGTEASVAFDLGRTGREGYDIELRLDPDLAPKRWKPLVDLVPGSEGAPVSDLGIDWTVRHEGHVLARRSEAPTLRQGHLAAVQDPVVVLGHFEPRTSGPYELRVHVEQVPPGLRGERVELLVDADAWTYKDVSVTRGARAATLLFLTASAVITLLLGLLALALRPREATPGG